MLSVLMEIIETPFTDASKGLYWFRRGLWSWWSYPHAMR